MMKYITACSVIAVVLASSSCRSTCSVELLEGGRIPVTAAFDARPDGEAVALLSPYKAKIDSIMTPVIGHSRKKMAAYRPESPLSNFMADLLRTGVEKKTGRKADVGIMNMGGIRSMMKQGAITVGDAYEICPFQNALVAVTLKGDALLELFGQIAALHGEGLSGARLIVSKEGKLLHASVDGKPIEAEKDYLVATIDYVAAGNDHMEAFKKGVQKVELENVILRDVLIEYVKGCEASGRMIDADVEGRIVLK